MNKSLSTSASQQVKPITLAGSATIVTQFFRHAVNSILYQRGVYSPESFERKQEYGITLFVSKDKEIVDYFDSVLPNLEGWLTKSQLKSLSLVIISSLTGETLEKWDFDIQTVQDNDVTITGKPLPITARKDLTEISKSIRNVMRQITATVTFLPLLDTRCSFDLKIYLSKKATVGKEWKEETTDSVNIKGDSVDVVELRSWSTGVQRVKGRVTYKC